MSSIVYRLFRKKTPILGLLILFLTVELKSQEFKCNIQFVSQQIQGTNKKVFETLQQAAYQFINNRNWTSNVFTAEERIECNMLFNITDYSGNDFKGTLQIQTRRPVFNSSYNTVLFNYLDQNIQFTYEEFESLEFNESSFTSNLTSLLAYYAYVIIGLDYDSYSYKGGTDYFRKAENIVNNAQNATEKGWKPYETSNNKNRYWLIQNILDDKYSSVRDFLYKYHRLGLDVMAEKVNEGRDEIAESLKLLQQVYRQKPDPYMHLLTVIFDAKNEEWVNIFTESFPEEKTRVVAILKEIDPSNITKYQSITR
jgi:hypothetical protein